MKTIKSFCLHVSVIFVLCLLPGIEKLSASIENQTTTQITYSASASPLEAGSVSPRSKLLDAGATMEDVSNAFSYTVNEGYVFNRWRRTLYSNSPTASVTALFNRKTYTIQTGEVENGTISISPSGSVEHGTTVTITYNPATGYERASGSNTETFEASRDRTISESFVRKKYNVSIGTIANGSVTLSRQGIVEHGTWISVTYHPDEGYEWASEDNPEKIEITGDTFVTARFTPKPYTLSIGTIENGSITLSPPGGIIPYDTVVRITYYPDTGYTTSPNGNPATIIIKGDTTVSASFELKTYSVGTGTVRNGTVSVSPNGSNIPHFTKISVRYEPDWGMKHPQSKTEEDFPLEGNYSASVTFIEDGKASDTDEKINEADEVKETNKEDVEDAEKTDTGNTSETEENIGGAESQSAVDNEEVISSMWDSRQLHTVAEQVLNRQTDTDTNALTAGDPVYLPTGDFVHEETDIAIPLFSALPFGVKRSYRNNFYTESGFGNGWFADFEVRVLLGHKPRSREELQELETIRNDAYERWIENAGFLTYETERIAARIAQYTEGIRKAEEITAAYEAALLPAGEIDYEPHRNKQIEKINTEIGVWKNKTAEIQKLLDEVKRQQREDIPALTARVQGLKAHYEAMRDIAAFSRYEHEHSEDHIMQASRHSSRSGIQSAYSGTGLDRIVFFSENGSPMIFRLTRDPVYGGESYFPEGSPAEAVGLSTDRVELHADGSISRRTVTGRKYIYNIHGQLDSVQDRHGNSVRYLYSDDGKIERIQESGGRSIRILWEGNRISALIDPLEQEYRFEYNSAGELIKAIDPDGDWLSYAYRQNTIHRIGKPDGSAIDFGYENQNGVRVTSWTQDEEDNREHFDYDFDARQTVYTDPAGVYLIHKWDERQLDIHSRSAGGNGMPDRIIESDYTAEQRLKRSIERAAGYSEQIQTDFNYDSNGNITYIRHPDGSTETREYRTDAQPLYYLNPHGGRTVYEYSRDLLSSINYPDGSRESFMYYDDSRLRRHTNRLGLVSEYEYDQYGYVSRLLQRDGSTQAEQIFRHDALGRLTYHRDADGRATEYSYNAFNQITRIQYHDGREMHKSYNERKDLIREELRLYELSGAESFILLDATDFSYDARHLLESITNTYNERIEYDYDPAGKLERRRFINTDDLLIREIHYEYYPQTDLLMKSTETAADVPGNRNRQYRYDHLGRLQYEQNPAGQWQRYRYNYGTRQPISVEISQSADSPVGQQYYSLQNFSYRNGTLETVQNEWGTIRKFEYDSSGRRTAEHVLTDGIGLLGSYEYLPQQRKTIHTDGEDQRSWQTTDAWGRVLTRHDRETVARGLSFTSRNEYSPGGMLNALEYAEGLRQEYTYTATGRIESIQIVNARHEELWSQANSYHYDADGYLHVEVEDARGNSRRQIYDRLGRLVESRDAYNASRYYTYDFYGNIVTFTDETGLETRLEYDGYGRQTAEYQGGQITGSWDYNSLDQVIRHTDGEARVSEFVYDVYGRLVSRQQLDGSRVVLETEYLYDYAARTMTERTGNHVYTTHYDGLGRVAEYMDAFSKRRQFRYDGAGRLEGMTDFNGSEFRYDYDANGRILSVRANGTEQQSFLYDDRGRLISSENEHAAYQFDYDDLGRLRQQQNTSSGHSLSFGYDRAGNRISVADSHGSYARYSYGANNELLNVRDQYNRETSFAYDAAGREILSERWNGTSVARNYNEQGLLSSIIEYSGTGRVNSQAVWAEAYVYNNAQQVSGTVDIQGRVRWYDYDSIGRLEQVQYPLDSGKMQHDREERERLGLPVDTDMRYFSGYSLSSNDRSALQDAWHNMFSYSRGGLNLMVGAWTESFTYDAAGNRSTVENPFGNIIYTYNTANRLTQAGQRHYDYDVNGNLLKEYTDKELISYSYTPDNRVAEYQRVDLRLSKNGSEDPEIIQNYRYDGLGRRVSLSARNTRDTRNALPETRYEFYEYEGMGFSFARLQFSSVSTGNDLQKAPSDPGGTRYRPAPGSEHNGGTLFGDSYRIIHAQGRAASRISAQTGSLPGSQAAPGSNIIYSHDRLGSVVRESSMTGFGMASREYSYDAFGASIGTHSPEFFGYTGKPYDPITGMYDYGFRDYAPMQARFTTVDPIRDGTNWYAYVGNDPVNFVDPLGLEAVRSSDAATGGHAIPDSPEPTLWTQDRAKEEFGASFASKACAVTSIANAVSTQYTDTKQKALEDNAYNSMVGQSISDGHVNKTNAYIDSWSGAANSMAKAIGLDDDGSFTYNPDNDADHVIHAEDRSGLGYPGHFLLDQGDGTAHDPLSGTNRNIDEDFTAAQKGLGPTRGLDWKPKK